MQTITKTYKLCIYKEVFSNEVPSDCAVRHLIIYKYLQIKVNVLPQKLLNPKVQTQKK